MRLMNVVKAVRANCKEDYVAIEGGKVIELYGDPAQAGNHLAFAGATISFTKPYDCGFESPLGPHALHELTAPEREAFEASYLGMLMKLHPAKTA